MADEKLITLIENCPAMWDPSNSNFKNKNLREAAVLQVASKMHTTEEYVIKRFKSLREKYRKEKLKTEEAKISGDYFKEWKLLPRLRFLDKVQRKRLTVSTMPRVTSVKVERSAAVELSEAADYSSAGTDDESRVTAMLTRVFLPPAPSRSCSPVVPNPITPSPPSSPSAEPPLKKRSANERTGPVLERLADVLETATASLAAPVRAEDACDVYSKYVACCLRQMSKNSRKRAILEINKIIYSYTSDD